MSRLHFKAWLLAGVGVVLLATGYLFVAMPVRVHAQEAQSAMPSEPTGDNSFCLVCHADTDATAMLADGTQLHVAVDPAELENSVHGSGNEQGALGCVDCHGTDIFPHDSPLPESARAYTIRASLACTNCHVDQTENLADGVHYSAIVNGNLNSASCVDCHGSHNIQPPDEPREKISETCGECHTTTFTEYRDSVHGQALFEGDPNVPTCIDCHGVHGIQHPTTALFRNRSPELCATCHADTELMEEYGISTYVFESYLTDFHGTTVQLFNQEDPNVPTNKAVCYDCHGVHNIAEANSENSRVIRENLLDTCRTCHPDASADFPDSWVGHFPPSLDNHPLMFLVNLFYQILIPVVVGGFLFLIATDIIRRIRKMFSGRSAE
ncbi:MAG: cytochrome c3 family protein [Anaerolineae bacterium]|nr:cytochrome c3 family protein [Anaerolineae bacterium]MCB9459770.1 cytochrome c3 family protein [Anaerolineaceae bacterium]